MAKKGGREKIRLNSTAGTGHFYTTDKNRRTTPGKMEMMKYDPVVRQHVLYKEGKIKYHRLKGKSEKSQKTKDNTGGKYEHSMVNLCTGNRNSLQHPVVTVF